jgi:flagellar biosynthesis/type III secretory pathway chaperone
MCNPAQELQNTYDTVSNTGQKLISGVNKTIDNIARNPLPIIETAALVVILGPEGLALELEPATIAAVSSAAVSAANGGNVEQIALSAGAAYLGSQVGKEAGNAVTPIEQKTLEQMGPQYADTAWLKQVVTSSSASAATTALRGGDLTAILTSGVSGGVNSAVTAELKAQGYTEVDQKLIANASDAATRAILAGKDVATAIGSSVASTALAATISGNVGQINKNNELAKDLMTKFDSLKTDAQKFYEENKLSDLYQTTQDNYTIAANAKKEYDNLLSTYTTKYNYYVDQKTQYEATKQDSFYNNANNTATELNSLAPQVDSVGQTATNAANTYNAIKDNYYSKVNAYTTNYVNPIKDINSQIEGLSTSNQKLADALGTDVMKYQSMLNIDATDVSKTLYDQNVVDQAVSAYKKSEADIKAAAEASKETVAQADTGTTTDAGTQTETKAPPTSAESVYIKTGMGIQEAIPDGKGGYKLVSDTVFVFGNGDPPDGKPTGNVYNLAPDGQIASLESSGGSDVVPDATTRTLSDGSVITYNPDKSGTVKRPNGSIEEFDVQGNVTNVTPPTTPTPDTNGNVTIFNALQQMIQNTADKGLTSQAVKNADGSITVGSTTIKPDGSVTGGTAQLNPDGTVSVNGSPVGTTTPTSGTTTGTTTGGTTTGGTTTGGTTTGGTTTGTTTGGMTQAEIDAATQKAIADQKAEAYAKMLADQKAAADAKATADRNAALQIAGSPAKLSALQMGVASLIPQVQNAVTAASQNQTAPVQQEVVKTTNPFNIENPLEAGYFGSQLQTQNNQKNTQNQDGTVKIASGGSIRGLPGLLRRRG